MSVAPTGLGLSGVLALRAQILEKSQALAPARAAIPATAEQPGGFTSAMADALKAVNSLQTDSSTAGAAWERGETQDIAAVMLSRQKASIAFEATLQARNRLLSAYRDIMNMPV
jgi:flagellar hook-basal body complex protein FliE